MDFCQKVPIFEGWGRTSCLATLCRCVGAAIDGTANERTSESELIGQVENDQRAHRVIDHTRAVPRTRATRG